METFTLAPGGDPATTRVGKPSMSPHTAARPHLKAPTVAARGGFSRGCGGPLLLARDHTEPVLRDRIIKIIDPEQFAPRLVLVSSGLLLDAAAQPAAVGRIPRRPSVASALKLSDAAPNCGPN
jgi:hypothetical protein